MSTTAISRKKQPVDKDDWILRLNGLVQQVTSWVASEPGWTVGAGYTVITEDEIGTYAAPTLTIDTGNAKAILEPIALVGFGVRGIVELFAWPTLYRVRLLMRPELNSWDVMTDSGIRLRQKWDRDSFVILVRDLVSAS